jgi:hypothetical protein
MSVSTESKRDLSDNADLVTWDLTMTSKTAGRLNQLARDIEGSPEDVLGLALALFTVAVRAKQEGKGIAVVDPEGNIDTEITGF